MCCMFWKNRKETQKTDGVLNVSVNLPLQTGEVVFDETKIQLDKIIKIIEDLGYGAKLFNKSFNEESSEKWILIKIVVGFIFSIPLFSWNDFSPITSEIC